MKTISIRLRYPIRNGDHRSLTKSECDFIKSQNTGVRPYGGKSWSIGRNDDGQLSLRHDLMDGGASWAVVEVGHHAAIDWSHFPLESAISCAERAADKYEIPQTVFSNESTAGWWHTSTGSKVLSSAKVHVTILPGRFFQ